MSSDVFVIVNILNTTTSLSFLCLYSNHYSFLSFSLLLWNIVYTLKKKKKNYSNFVDLVWPIP